MELYRKNLNMEKLQEILDCFVVLTGIRATYFDITERVSGKSMGSCDYCRSVRQIASIDEECIKSDNAAFRKASEIRQVYLYTCPMGLWEAVVPLFARNSHVGYLMIGQVKSFGGGDSWEMAEAVLGKLKISLEEVKKFKDKYETLPEYQFEQIEAAVKMLDIMAQNIIQSEIIRIYDSTTVEKAKEYLKQHFTEPVSVMNLARELKVSTSTLLTLFKKETGTTVMEHLQLLRINRAKELLQMTSLSVKEISDLCGYEDQNYFSRVFKRNVDSSPVQYRQQFKKMC